MYIATDVVYSEFSELFQLKQVPAFVKRACWKDFWKVKGL